MQPDRMNRGVECRLLLFLLIPYLTSWPEPRPNGRPQLRRCARLRRMSRGEGMLREGASPRIVPARSGESK